MQEQIIQFLKKSDGYLSGEEISRALNISRAGIWKHMQDLRQDGYEIVAVPHLGYRLLSSPDKLLPHEIKSDLTTRSLGRNLFCHEQVTSTMDAAFKLGVAGEAEGTVVCAETQTQGRGRLGRSWSSPKGKGVYMSVILRPRLYPSEAAKLTLLCAVAVCEAVQNVSGVNPQIKWPNDLLVGKRKLAGILTELSAEVDRVKFVTVGIGLNVNSTAHHLPPEATSLKIESGKTISRVKVIQEILRVMEMWYDRVPGEGFQGVLQRWRELSVTLGRRIKVVDPGGTVEGEAMDLDSDGGLLIRSDAGMMVKKMSGDVIQVR